MEVRIGVQHVAKELVIESDLPLEKVQKLIDKALSTAGDVLHLTDEKGRQVVVPTDKLAYIEIGAVQQAKVGFGF